MSAAASARLAVVCEAGEEELAEIAHGESVVAGDLFGGKLLDDIADEMMDAGGILETRDTGEEAGHRIFRRWLAAGQLLAQALLANFVMVIAEFGIDHR